MLVKELFDQFDLDEIDDRAEENDYWKSVKRFVDDNLNNPLELLSHKQKAWMLKITDTLGESGRTK